MRLFISISILNLCFLSIDPVNGQSYLDQDFPHRGNAEGVAAEVRIRLKTERHSSEKKLEIILDARKGFLEQAEKIDYDSAIVSRAEPLRLDTKELETYLQLTLDEIRQLPADPTEKELTLPSPGSQPNLPTSSSAARTWLKDSLSLVLSDHLVSSDFSELFLDQLFELRVLNQQVLEHLIYVQGVGSNSKKSYPHFLSVSQRVINHPLFDPELAFKMVKALTFRRNPETRSIEAAILPVKERLQILNLLIDKNLFSQEQLETVHIFKRQLEADAEFRGSLETAAQAIDKFGVRVTTALLRWLENENISEPHRSQLISQLIASAKDEPLNELMQTWEDRQGFFDELLTFIFERPKFSVSQEAQIALYRLIIDRTPDEEGGYNIRSRLLYNLSWRSTQVDCPLYETYSYWVQRNEPHAVRKILDALKESCLKSDVLDAQKSFCEKVGDVKSIFKLISENASLPEDLRKEAQSLR